MAELAQDLTELVKVLVTPLIEHADELSVTAAEPQGDGKVTVEIRVNPDDAGKVIGRQGRVIKAVRTLARAAASAEDAQVDVELID